MKKTIPRLQPGLELNVGTKYDDNSFLVNNDWLPLVESPTPTLDNIAAATEATEAAWSRGDIILQPWPGNEPEKRPYTRDSSR